MCGCLAYEIMRLVLILAISEVNHAYFLGVESFLRPLQANCKRQIPVVYSASIEPVTW